MDRRTVLAFVICFLIFMGWQKFYVDPRLKEQQAFLSQQRPQTTSEGASRPVGQAVIGMPNSEKKGPREKVILRTGTGEATVGDDGPFFLDWHLKSYKLGISPEAAAVNLPSVIREDGVLQFAFDDPSLAYLNNVTGKLVQTQNGLIWKYEDKNVKLTRQFVGSDQVPYVDLIIEAEFKTKAPRYAFVSVAGKSPENDPEAQDRQIVYWTNNSLEREQLKGDVKLKEVGTPVKYIGVTNRYFVMAVVNKSVNQPGGLIQPLGPSTGRMSLVYPIPITDRKIQIPLQVYFGPKEIDLLKKVDPSLTHVIDFGWFTVFALPLLTLLKWLYQFLKNYGLAIIVLTLLLKLVTYPLTYKSMKSMKKMAKLQPQLAKIREKYKDDKEALNREMLTMMKNHGYNPMAGCLPLLIQMPIFFALYRVLYSSIELYHAPFFLWIKDLSSQDPFYVTPVLLTLTMFIQQKLTPNTAADPAQAKMMQFMPIMFGAFMIALPAGLTVYMLANALAGIVQQIVLNKKFDAAPA